jgi:hypothetical protein
MYQYMNYIGWGGEEARGRKGTQPLLFFVLSDTGTFVFILLL